jgi:hypothetical protein
LIVNVLVVLPFYTGDAQELFRLLEWIEQLGGCKNHDALLVTDAATNWDLVRFAAQQASQSFSSIRVVAHEKQLRGWPQAANALLFLSVRQISRPFLWLEPDAVPLKPLWLDEIEHAYEGCGMPFMGCIMETNQQGFPGRYMAGVGVYPGDSAARLLPFEECDRAWDIASAEDVVPHTANSPLIQHFWGERNLPPTFTAKRTKQSAINALSLDDLSPKAVVFHRNKDGMLIRLLRRKLFPDTVKNQEELITVVFPICTGDAALAIHHAKWLSSMNRKNPNAALVSFDTSLNPALANELKAHLQTSFSSVGLYRYQAPRNAGWPDGANAAWQNAARRMCGGRNPWLWFEADCVALTPDWLERLQEEYERGRKSFMGAIVPDMGHMQGTGIYPDNAGNRLPRAMAATNMAWDYVMKPEMIADCHNAFELVQHLWLIENGEVRPHGGGEVPQNITKEKAERWITPRAAMLHRVKDASLVSLLLRREFVP